MSNKPALVIVNSNYPNPENKYGDVFVHSRLKHYLPYFKINVVGWKKKLADHSFNYEGIDVDVVNTDDKLIAKLRQYKPDVIGFHFVEGWMYSRIIKPFTGPVFIWVHGGEALGWYRRLFMFSLKNIYTFARYVARNTIQMVQMHNLISYSNKNGANKVQFIFVSNWMRSITEADTLSTIKHVKYIPNPIDPSLFKYTTKSVEQRNQILLIRSFDSKKYANDLAVEAILRLSKKPYFDRLNFTIYGVGKYFAPLTDRIKHFPNVRLNNFFLENKDIPRIHQAYGVFLVPTRQDAQGVSMCEAMSSGLVPITSNNTAIPEFVIDKKSGFLTNSVEEIVDAIELLHNNPETFQEMSRQASEHIQSLAGTDTVVRREIALIQQSLNMK
jgi:glycosyltransferase involved in cell wall biosynthesis